MDTSPRRTLPPEALEAAVATQLQPAETHSLAELWNAVYAVRWSKNRTAYWARWAWKRHLEGRFGLHALSDLEPEDLEAYFASIEHRKAEHNRLLCLLRTAFRTARRWRWTQLDPTAGIERKREAPRTSYLTLEELRAFEQARLEALANREAHPGALVALRLLMLTGCRPSELARLTWEEYHPDSRTLRLKQAKTGPRTVALSNAAADLLDQHRLDRKGAKRGPVFGYYGGKPLAIASLRAAFWTVAKRAGLPIGRSGFRLYDLRRSFGTLLIQSGTETALVAQALGHADERTTRRHYAFLKLDQARPAVEAAGEKLSL